MLGNQKIVSMISPVAAGKTFIAVNLATAAAKSKNVALVDLDFNERAVHTWFNLPPGYNELDLLLSGECVEPVSISGVKVYAADPCLGALQEQMGSGFINKIKEEWIIVDMPRKMDVLHKEVLGHSALAVWIGDPDYHHLLRIRDVIDIEPFLIINKHKELQSPLDYKELFGVEPEKIPVFDGVYDSILTGEPLVCTDPDARKLFAKLYQKMKLTLR
jgi:cellulose biosynthesis protein BcsQ